MSKDGSQNQAWPVLFSLINENRKRRVELIAKTNRRKGAAEGNIVTIADKEGVWYGKSYPGLHQYAAILFPEDRFAVFQILSS